MTALSLTNVTKTYANGVNALKGISLNVKKGDFFALLGANGAGKSTTIGIITSLVKKTSGQVSVFGHDLDFAANQAKQCIGLVPQEFNCNIFEKCSFILRTQAGYYGIPKKIAIERAEYYLNKLKLWDKRNEIARRLSGGMKRRLMIARALVHEPKMLILDEPTAGVDIEIRHTMWEFLQELNDAGTTIILTTHYLEEAEKLCRNIAIIKGGNIALENSMANLLKEGNNRRIIVELANPISSLPIFKSFQAHSIDSQKLEITLKDKSNLNDVFDELSQHNFQVTHLTNDASRLEHLFLGLINHE